MSLALGSCPKFVYTCTFTDATTFSWSHLPSKTKCFRVKYLLIRAPPTALSVPLRLITRGPPCYTPVPFFTYLIHFFTSRLWLSVPGSRSSSALHFRLFLRSFASSDAGFPPYQPSDFGPSSTPFGLHRPPPAAPLLTRLIPTASSVTRPRNAHIPAFPARPRALPSPCLQGREEHPQIPPYETTHIVWRWRWPGT